MIAALASLRPRVQIPSRPLSANYGTNNKIFNVLWQMRKDGYAEETIKGYTKRLKHLERNTDLDNPEEVKAYIAQKDVSNTYKEALVIDMNWILNLQGIYSTMFFAHNAIEWSYRYLNGLEIVIS
jgi:hypothetical protein